MKVLVTGVKGQLGYDVVNELTKRGIEAVGVDIQEMDITDAASVEKVIGEAAPDAVNTSLIDMLIYDHLRGVSAVSSLSTKNC